MSVTRDDIRKIAALAELAVDDAAAAELEGQLSRILDYVSQLAEVPQDVTPSDDERTLRLRSDDITPDPLLDEPAAFAPAFKQGLFLVPRLGELDRGEDAP